MSVTRADWLNAIYDAYSGSEVPSGIPDHAIDGVRLVETKRGNWRAKGVIGHRTFVDMRLLAKNRDEAEKEMAEVVSWFMRVGSRSNSRGLSPLSVYRKRGRIVSALREGPLTTKQIRKATGAHSESTLMCLRIMSMRGELRSVGDGKRGSPVVYSLREAS